MKICCNLIDPRNSAGRILFDGFQNRPWWTRAWIIQEVMSSANPVLNSGPDSLSFNLVLRLVKFALNKDLNLVTPNSKINVTSRFPSLEIVSMRDRMRSVRKPHLSEWLTTFHNQNATNPRDRIFAYLGLARHALPFAPQTTYTNRIEDVWAEGTKLALCMSNNLDFICLGRGMTGEYRGRIATTYRQIPKNEAQRRNWKAF